jgi:hypothetical protein
MLVKMIGFIAALTIGGTALAQTAGTQTSAPGNAAPELDARGIPVVSDPAEVPAGANEATPIAPGAVYTPRGDQRTVFTPRAASETYPPCTRTVTDNCVQTYERRTRR